ncbi:MAG: hypothetical protein QOK08_374 [Actinomycetota bacterium]|nr:hypothetical protein [Actinomycetota bacterium]
MSKAASGIAMITRIHHGHSHGGTTTAATIANPQMIERAIPNPYSSCGEWAFVHQQPP